MMMEYLNLCNLNNIGYEIFGDTCNNCKKCELKEFDFSNFFDSTTSQKYRMNILNDFVKWCAEENNRKIPKKYWKFLHELLSYDLMHKKIEYTDIQTFFIGKDCNNNVISYYTKDNVYHQLSKSRCVKDLKRYQDMFRAKKKDKILQILRNISKIDTNKLRNNIKLPVKSEISGKIITDISDIHIDHYDDDFVKVEYDWLYKLKYYIEKTEKCWVDIFEYLYDNYADEECEYFTNKNLNMNFYNYHKTHTHLRIVTKNENLSRPKYKVDWDYLKINGYYKEKYDKEQKFN